MCVFDVNPSLTVSHVVVSLTVPTKTAPVGSNPFEDDEDEEEDMAVEQQTTVNHISVNKDEIKTLVNRRKHSTPPAALPPFLLSIFSPWIVVRSSSPVVTLPYLLCSLLPRISLSSLRWQVVVLLCMVTEMALHTKPVCVCLSLLTVPCLAEHFMSCAWGRMSLLWELQYVSVLQSDLNILTHLYIDLLLILTVNKLYNIKRSIHTDTNS